jgi:hypothetical protein
VTDGLRMTSPFDVSDIARLSPVEFEALCGDILESRKFALIRNPPSSAGFSIDFVAIASTTDALGLKQETRMAVECRHSRHSDLPTLRAENFIQSTISHHCQRFLLMTSGRVSGQLIELLNAASQNPSIGLAANVWTGDDICKALEQLPTIKSRYFSRTVTPGPTELEPTAEQQLMAIHLHPDFQDELLDLLNAWNSAQDRISFIPIRPPRAIESRLLSRQPLSTEDAIALAEQLKEESGFDRSAGILLFVEGRLFGEDLQQMFSITMPGTVWLESSVVSLNMMRVLSGRPTVGAMSDRGHHGEGEHHQRDVTMPAMP